MKKTNLVTFYLRKGQEIIYEKFKEICDREGEKIGQKFVHLMQEYNSKHWDGNPQTSLEYSGLPKTMPRYKTCRYSNKGLKQGLFHCNKEAFWVIPKKCDKCFYYDQE